ncbi:MAG: hypothetical protein U0992_01605 [Planctomycetaceae bacterium]
MEPIVLVCTRHHRDFRAIVALGASACLWLTAPVVLAQAPPTAPAAAAPAATPPAAAPAADASKYPPPLTDKAKVKDWETKQNGELRFKTALKQERLANADREVLTNALKVYLHRMTIREKEEQEKMHTTVQRLLDALKLASPEARNFVNEEVVRLAPELLRQPPGVRLNVLILAANLSSDPSTDPPRPFNGATPLFLSVVDDPEQLPESKIWAVKGLARIARETDVSALQRDSIATHLADALNATDAQSQANWWYRLRIIDSLGDVGQLYNLQRQPVIIDSLMSVGSNRKEHPMVRATALRAVTQLPWLPGDAVNVPLVTYEICSFVREAAQVRNVPANINAPHWKYCFLCSYLAFNPQTAAQKQKNWGLLQKVTQPGYTQYAPSVQAAYQAILPVVNAVIGSKNPRAINADEIKSLDEWLQNNRPQDRKPTPSSKQVEQSEGNGPPVVKNR